MDYLRSFQQRGKKIIQNGTNIATGHGYRRVNEKKTQITSKLRLMRLLWLIIQQQFVTIVHIKTTINK